ncbi:MAG: hypothetical protein EBZ77_14255 [Chitinophagia bacterium]|nr:hypothetical protein [Chitinophagia bacterium]
MTLIIPFWVVFPIERKMVVRMVSAQMVMMMMTCVHPLGNACATFGLQPTSTTSKDRRETKEEEQKELFSELKWTS